MSIKKVIFPENLNDLEKEIANMVVKTDKVAKQATKELAEYGLQ